MGANATTFVPSYTSGDVLTAANLSVTNSGIPVFATTVTRDAAFGGTGEKTLAQGQFCYLESTGKLQVYTGSAWSNVGSQTNITAFTASGTFTVPAGVTYAIAHITGGGGSVGTGSIASGGNSSVAFASGTITATGGAGVSIPSGAYGAGATGTANSGQGAVKAFKEPQSGASAEWIASTAIGLSGAYIVAGATVTPAASITVTVGAGGAAGTAGNAGGTGYVYIEYEV